MNYEQLSQTVLFKGCTETQVHEILSSVKYHISTYHKGDAIYHVGDITTEVGLILNGSVQIENIDLGGNRSILGIASQGDVFAESYACIPNQPMLVDVYAREQTRILFINVPSLFAEQETLLDGSPLIRNLLFLASRKNLGLSMRIFHSRPKTIRARLLSYFSEQVSLQGSNIIVIPLDRQQMADYLGVERTALSKELGKMRDEGLLEYHKNKFNLHI